MATELRRLLHNIRRQESKAELKSILITSATTGEGKSTMTSLLGLTAAKRGFKTLLLDCDLRRPSLHRMFGIDRSPGMSDVLSEAMPLKNVIRKTTLDNLDIVTAGKQIAHPTELLDSRIIHDLIGELKFYYDFALVDAPPIIPVSDPMLIAQELDGTIIVILAGVTPREIVKRATEIMTSQQIKLLGVVLNNTKGSLPYHYDSVHYHYDYEQQPTNPGTPTGTKKTITANSAEGDRVAKGGSHSKEPRGNRMPR